MHKYDYTYTIFTATYNRANKLHRVYNSLLTQTYRNFEWIIVDDGSADNTRQVVEGWQKEAPFPISYIWQHNQHKKTAFNKAVKLAKGEFFLNADNDDEFVSNCLERFYYHWNSIPENQRSDFVGINCLCKTPDNELYGDKFPEDVFDCDARQLFYRYRVRSEKWALHKTDILRQFPFPEDVSGYVPETVVWFNIARYYKMRCINEALRIFYIETDSVGSNYKITSYCDGGALMKSMIVERDWKWIIYDPITIIKAAGNLTRFQLHLKKEQPEKRWPVRGVVPKVLVLLLWPVGYFYYLRDCKSINAQKY